MCRLERVEKALVAPSPEDTWDLIAGAVRNGLAEAFPLKQEESPEYAHRRAVRAELLSDRRLVRGSHQRRSTTATSTRSASRTYHDQLPHAPHSSENISARQGDGDTRVMAAEAVSHHASRSISSRRQRPSTTTTPCWGSRSLSTRRTRIASTYSAGGQRGMLAHGTCAKSAWYLGARLSCMATSTEEVGFRLRALRIAWVMGGASWTQKLP